jgi:hypothetical protein
MHHIEEGYTKAMMQFVKLAAKWGAKPIKTTGKHLKFRDNLGNQISAPKTSSDFRAIRNFKSELKNRGFVQQLPTSKVKAAKLDKPSTETVTPTKQTANQQTTFKDFMNKVRPILSDVKRPETTASRMGRGYRKAIKELPLKIKSEMGDKIIKQLSRESYVVERLSPEQKDKKLYYQYKDVTNPKQPLRPLDILKQKKGLPLAQLAPIGKSNQLPGKYSKMVITTDTPSDRMKSLEDRVRRYGNLKRLKDIDERNP